MNRLQRAVIGSICQHLKCFFCSSEMQHVEMLTSLGNPAAVSHKIAGLRPEALRPRLSTGLPFSSFFAVVISSTTAKNLNNCKTAISSCTIPDLLLFRIELTTYF